MQTAAPNSRTMRSPAARSLSRAASRSRAACELRPEGPRLGAGRVGRAGRRAPAPAGAAPRPARRGRRGRPPPWPSPRPPGRRSAPGRARPGAATPAAARPRCAGGGPDVAPPRGGQREQQADREQPAHGRADPGIRGRGQGAQGGEASPGALPGGRLQHLLARLASGLEPDEGPVRAELQHVPLAQHGVPDGLPVDPRLRPGVRGLEHDLALALEDERVPGRGARHAHVRPPAAEPSTAGSATSSTSPSRGPERWRNLSRTGWARSLTRADSTAPSGPRAWTSDRSRLERLPPDERRAPVRPDIHASMSGDGARGRPPLPRAEHAPPRPLRPGPGLLDWANQPEPFRSYAGAPRVELPLAGDDLAASWGDLHRPGAVAPRPLDRASLGAFFELALGLTAWKEHGGARWALRANPSSGNLHPTEGYALVAEAPGVPAGLYHYLSRDHVLERRLDAVGSGRRAASPACCPPASFLVGLASIHWREAWKYGERAFRYCQHDVGHALARVRYAAGRRSAGRRACSTPRATPTCPRSSGSTARPTSQRFTPADREHPDALVLVAPARRRSTRRRRAVGDGPRRAPRPRVRDGDVDGLAQRASARRTSTWPAIADVADGDGEAAHAARSPAAGRRRPRSRVGLPDGSESAGAGRRRYRPSASSASAAARWPWTGRPGYRRRLLRACSIGSSRARASRPGTCSPGRPACTRCSSSTAWTASRPGSTSSSRAPARTRRSGRPCGRSFAWARPGGCPECLPLFLLEEGDTRSFARLASCQQEIASDSAFAVAMLADLAAASTRGLVVPAAALGGRRARPGPLPGGGGRAACAARASAATSTTSSTRRSASRTAASATSTTSRSAARSRTGGSPRAPATPRT